MQGYDAWLTTDLRREAAESCAEGEHRFDDGRCVHCGEEDDGAFDPDDKRDRAKENADA